MAAVFLEQAKAQVHGLHELLAFEYGDSGVNTFPDLPGNDDDAGHALHANHLTVIAGG